jgi:hypothetical protein
LSEVSPQETAAKVVSEAIQKDTTTPTDAAAAPEIVKEEPKAEDKFAGKFAALSRKEREVQQKFAELKAEQKKIEADRAEYEKYKSLKTKAKENPLEWLKEGGVNYDELTRYIINDNKPDPDSKIQTLEQKIKQWEEEKERDKLKEAEVKKTQAIEDYIQNIKAFVKDGENATKYELIQAFNYEPVVYNVIEQHYQETKKLLTFDEACDLVEEHLESDVEAQAKKLSTGRLKSKLAQFFSEPPKQTEEAKANPAKTLTNNLASEGPRPGRFLSRDELIAEVAKNLKWVKD